MQRNCTTIPNPQALCFLKYSKVAIIHYDTILFPLLQEIKFAFCASSPIAGGFLVKSAGTLRSIGESRWNLISRSGKLYHGNESKRAPLGALSEWESIASKAGISEATLAYRWVKYSFALSPGQEDGTNIGASFEEQ